MSDPKRPDFELHHDPRIGHLMYYCQRGGWVVLALIIGGALLGFAGPGPLSTATAEGDGVRIRYHRFTRMTSPTKVEITAEHGREIHIGRDYLSRFEVQTVVPEPESVEARGNVLTYRFAGPAETPLKVELGLKAAEGSFGLLHGNVGTGQSTVGFRQFIWP